MHTAESQQMGIARRWRFGYFSPANRRERLDHCRSLHLMETVALHTVLPDEKLIGGSVSSLKLLLGILTLDEKDPATVPETRGEIAPKLRDKHTELSTRYTSSRGMKGPE
jgi:hypothetical protein